MSLETLHTDAHRAALLLKQVPARIAAKLCGVELSLALQMHEWLTAAPHGEQHMPAAFKTGAPAACCALIKVSVVRPVVFWGGLIALPSLPILLALRWI
ncbi:hypothetical protein RN01_25215 [Cupriavidus sp. SHE]|uniref:hypothetical protein n=1 Tax=Cupriavidus TaxID=106589 RepID=UPI00056AFD97|nr:MULTISPECIES: hypothetical protein [Cupriavidus]KWR78077.1 hypothetical protein RN01_25215 [Cupriavidus sp. SHE]GMG95020.1 hypothetical protein Cmtc_62400 [Cupriavidus sp. TKC]